MTHEASIGVLATAVLVFSLAASAEAQSGKTTRVSVDSNGIEGNKQSELAAISGNGLLVAFESHADNLVAGDTNGVGDVFVHDTGTGLTTRVSVDSIGAQANGFSEHPSLSSDGRYVVFHSFASNLVPGDTNGKPDVFLHDRVTGRTSRVSIGPGGIQGNGLSRDPSLTPDGRYVAYSSTASNLVPGDTNAKEDIFVHDRATGQTTRASIDSAGSQADDDSDNPSISSDGRFVSFSSFASNLVPGDTNLGQDVFVHDRTSGQTTRVSVDSSGNQASGSGLPFESPQSSISSDGRFVAFDSAASDLVPGDTNSFQDVFIHDRVTGQTDRISVSSSGQQALGGRSSYPSLSSDGRFVAFASDAVNLVAGDDNGSRDVFVHDHVLGHTSRISVDSSGNQAHGRSSRPSISSDSHRIAFQSEARDLVPNDWNQVEDVFHHDRGCPPAFTYCSASATSLPGCQASISSSGQPSLADPTGFVISSGLVPGGVAGLCLFGDSGPASTPLGTMGGFLCVQPPFFRAAVKPSGGTTGTCSGSFDYTLQELIDAAPIIQPGANIYAQIWARDPLNPDGFLLSDGLVFTVCS